MVMQFNILLLFVILCSSTAAAAITAQVDRYSINMNETINLMIEVSGDDSGEPDTSPVEQDFTILSRNQSSSYSLINGAMSSKSTWFLVLRPRRAGSLSIPALSIGSKQTTAINIQVNKTIIRPSSGAAPQGHLWIDMRVEPETVRVQQQAIITLRIYQAVTLSQAQLTEPQSDRAMIVRLGEDKTYQVNREGRNWSVTERRYALFPQQHGSLKLEPVQLTGSVLAGRSNYGSPFQSTRPVHVQSNALQLAVDAMPDDWQGHTWLPAKQVELSEDWPSGEFTVGDSITRTLTLRANGLNSSQLPELTILLPDHLKAYADKAVLSDHTQSDGVHGSRQEKLAILATRPGIFILPGLDVRWWNTETQTMQTASLPPRTFKVSEALVNIHQPSPSHTANIKPEITPEKNPVQPNLQASFWWKWLALFSTLGWLLSLVFWFYKSRDRQVAPSDSDVLMAITTLKKNVLQACQKQQSKACEQSLLHFAALQWPHANIHNLTTLAMHCDTRLAQEVKTLERQLYAKKNNDIWQAKQLQFAFEQADFTVSYIQTSVEKKALPALYPK